MGLGGGLGVHVGLTIALGTLSYAASGFLLQIFGIAPSRWMTATVAIVIIALGTGVNIVGRRVLKIMVIASITARSSGRSGSASCCWCSTARTRSRRCSPAPAYPTQGRGRRDRCLLAIAFVGWSFLGFEAAGSVAEEVDDPERNVPKAIVFAFCWSASW